MMSSSWNTEEKLKEQAEKLREMVNTLEDAAEILRSLREDGEIIEQFKSNIERAKDWMKR
jgi:hypothetical protein